MLYNHIYNGKKLGLRVLNKDGTSFDGFKNSLTPGDIITCPDWEPTNECGNGLHFWPWGHGRADKDFAGDKLWQVVEYEECIALDRKAKAPWLKVIFTGNEAECMKILLPGLIAYSASNSGDCSSASNSGYYSSASNSGDCSSASNTGYHSSASNSGNCSSASNSGECSLANNSGNYSSASNSGNCSSASNSGHRSSASNSGTCSSANNSGDYSSASNSGNCSSASNSGNSSSASNSGHRSSATNSGYHSSASAIGKASAAVVTSIQGKAMAGPYGCIALQWYNEQYNRYEMVCEEVGNGEPDKLLPNVWYTVSKERKIIPYV